jgi:hypothetical protein
MFLLLFWKKIAAASRKTLGLKEGDEMFLQMDRASCHFSKLTQEELKKVGFTVIKQPPRSPDFNMLDAFLFPTLERECEKKGAVAREEIVAAVRSVWAKVTAEECKKAHKRILRNMERAIDLKGGAFLPRRQVISLSFNALCAFSWVRKARFVCTILAAQYWPSLH